MTTTIANRLRSGKMSLGYHRDETDIGDMKDFAAMGEYMLDQFDEAMLFDVQNVYDYFEASPQTRWRFDRDFPNVAPIAPVMWMEYRMRGVNYAWMFISEDRGPQEDLRWYVNAFMFRDQCDDPNIIIAPSPIVVYAVNADGTCYIPAGADRSGVQFIGMTSRERAEDLVQCIFPVMLALSFMHCKNVVINQDGDFPKTRQERRAAKLRGDKPRIRHHTLHIEPMKAVLATEGGIKQNGLKKSLHICRGHFSEYGDEYGKGKLFGKYEGRFFIPAHVRGTAEQGITLKDYAVHPPKNRGEAA